MLLASWGLAWPWKRASWGLGCSGKRHLHQGLLEGCFWITARIGWEGKLYSVFSVSYIMLSVFLRVRVIASSRGWWKVRPVHASYMACWADAGITAAWRVGWRGIGCYGCGGRNLHMRIPMGTSPCCSTVSHAARPNMRSAYCFCNGQVR